MPLIVGLPYPARAGAQADVLAAMAKSSLPPRNAARRDELSRQAADAVRNYFREDQGRDQIEAKLDLLRDWCGRHGVPADRVVFTEYGAMRTGDDGSSRRRWLHDVSDGIASRGWGWTLWVLKQGPFGLDDDTGRSDPELLKAIGVGAPGQR